MEILECTVVVGVGATLFIDLWAIVRRSVFGVALPDYGLVGRWLAHMARGRFRHVSIAASQPIRRERFIGWAAHYAIGIAFAALLLAVTGPQWAHRPTLLPALIVGIGTVAAPFLLVQPGMGLGIAASRTARPAAARMNSLLTHALFGLGLYLTAALIVPQLIAR